MQDGTQGATQGVNSDATQGLENVPSAGQTLDNLQNPPSAPLEGATVQANNDDVYRKFQSETDKLRAQVLQTQYMLQQALQQKQTPQAPQVTENPYDPMNDSINYWKWEQGSLARSVANETVQGLLSYAQQQAQMQQELSWQQQHPGVDLNAVKMFAQMRGVQNLDDAYTLMTLPNQLNNVRTQTAQQTINSFRQPTSGTTNVRGQGAGEQGLSYESLLKAWNENPTIEDTWSPQLKEMFRKETNARMYLYNTRS